MKTTYNNFFTIERVSKEFGGIKALDNVSFLVKMGEIHGIIGPNGAGKTTLFNCINGLTKITEGRIVFKDKEIQNLPPYKISHMGIGRTFQKLKLFENMSVAENIMAGYHNHINSGILKMGIGFQSAKKEELIAKKKAYEILEFLDLYSEGPLPLQRLSFGELKLVEIGRAIVSKPDILLLDEPAGGLTPTEIEKLADIIVKIRSMGITIIMVEHNIDLVLRLCNRISRLDEGRITKTETINKKKA